MISTKLTFLEQPSANGNELVRSSFEISVENSEVRNPTHFVLLLDTSGSMEENNKLGNVKKCVKLLLTILNAKDMISVITFEDESEIILKRVPADENHKGLIEAKVNAIQPEGSTNLSASLANLKEVIKDESMKTGVILLTDGHANRGIHDTPSLLQMFKKLREDNPILSIACLAYGTDHNADLLKNISLESSGSYSIVSNLEDAATVIGDVFGSLISCCAQNVKVELPKDSTIEGPFTLKDSSYSETLSIGDIYSGSNTLYIVSLPAAAIRERKPLLTLVGTSMPSLDQLTIHCDTGVTNLERNKDVELTLLRYRCASLLKQLADWERLTSVERANLQESVRFFDDKLEESFFAGHSLTEMLKAEVKTMKNSIKMLLERRVHAGALRTHILQHESVLTSGRGYTQVVEESEDPSTYEIRSAAPVDLASPYRNRTQRRVAAAMRTMSTH
jgi:Mg-chelatase subunit ChlD